MQVPSLMLFGCLIAPRTGGATGVADSTAVLNAVRAAANLSAATWTDTSLTNVTIKAVHLQELRTNLDLALSTLGYTPGPYTDTSLAGIPIKKIHVDELRQRLK